MIYSKPIKGYEGRYKIYSDGKIWSNKNKRHNGEWLKPNFHHRDGYVMVQLFRSEDKSRYYYLARLVAVHFIDNPNNNKEVNHIDGDKLNNHIDNLEWCTRSTNMKPAFNTGLKKPVKGSLHYNSKLEEKDIIQIRELAKEGKSNVYISKIYKVSPENVSSIKLRKSWSHL